MEGEGVESGGVTQQHGNWGGRWARGGEGGGYRGDIELTRNSMQVVLKAGCCDRFK